MKGTCDDDCNGLLQNCVTLETRWMIMVNSNDIQLRICKIETLEGGSLKYKTPLSLSQVREVRRT